ncbi:hypothetical protein NL676_009105 [Syzygium grande]|nr:hypothetical protein NL676_009105 [Syzygium grande]
MLYLVECHSIQQLPELPKSLTALRLSSNSLTTILELSNLTNLVELSIIGTLVQEAQIKGLGRLRALRQLTLRVGKMALPPTDFSSLSQLQHLWVSCADSGSLIKLPSSLQELYIEDVQSPIDWSLFSNLENLSSLTIGGYTLEEIRFEVLGKLPKFNILGMSYCPLLETLTILPGLKEIQDLYLLQLPRLTEIQGLGELKSLRTLRMWDCNSIKSLNESDLSNLQNLKRLEICSCASLESMPGVPKSCQPTSVVARGSTETDKIDDLAKGAYGQALQNLNEMRLNYLPLFP